MNDPLYQQIRESNWRRNLTPSEEAKLRAWLAAHPEMEPDWETEAALSQALQRLPAAEVSSNFTARALAQVQRMERGSSPMDGLRRHWKWSWRLLAPQNALVIVFLVLSLFAYERHRAFQRAELARSLATVSGVAAESTPEIMQDFETIRHLDQTSGPDEQLLALLK